MIANNIDINNLDYSSLKKLLKELKSYKNLSKRLGKRWKKVFWNLINKNKIFRIEYYPSILKEDLFKIALDVYKKIFNEIPSIWDIEFIEKKELIGWIRIIYNDKMIDMSFLKLKKLLNKHKF